MRFGKLMIASAATAAALAGVAAAALARLPAGTRLPVHWNGAMVADRFAPAGQALFMPVALCGGLSLIMAAIPRIEPMQRNLGRSAALFSTAWAGMLGLTALVELAVAAPAFGFAPAPTLVAAGTGVLLILIGNALPKSRPGFFVGIRTPWTLSDPDNWVATHRFGAWTMIAGGALILVAAVVPIDGAARAQATLAAVLLATVPPVLYSFLYWQRRRPR